MSAANTPPRRLILVIFDTLRTDFVALAGADLPNFRRLRRLCSVFPKARCGSFPTGPMRTDLLTGRLSFLDARWALPREGEVTLTRALRDAGVWTTLVTDNYVATCPQIGGMLLPEFDVFDFIRGAGSDPWQTPSAALRALVADVDGRLPSRSVEFEIQYLANLAAWNSHGGSPTERVVASAVRQLGALEEHPRYLLWIDAFAVHEPWDDTPRKPPYTLPSLPLFPGYVERERFEEKHLAEWRDQYANSVRRLDRDLAPIVPEIERQMSRGDTALAMISDHGFLFGEYGFVGKPANTPLPPELHEIVCWLSSHFEPLVPSDKTVQPHILHEMIRRFFGIGDRTASESALHIFGRNSPRSNYIAATTDDTMYVGEKSIDGSSAVFAAVDRDPLRKDLPLMQQADGPLPAEIQTQFLAALARGTSSWLTPFKRQLEKMKHAAADAVNTRGVQAP